MGDHVKGLAEVQGDDISCLKGDRFFSRVCGDRTVRNGFKLEQRRFRLDIMKKFFTVSDTNTGWLPGEVVEGPSLEAQCQAGQGKVF